MRPRLSWLIRRIAWLLPLTIVDTVLRLPGRTDPRIQRLIYRFERFYVRKTRK